MTGFAAASVTTGSTTVTVEVRTVNSRYLDVHFRLPENLRSCEPALKKSVQGRLARGKVELLLRCEHDEENTVPSINSQVLERWRAALVSVAKAVPEAGTPDPWQLINAPGVLSATPIDNEALTHSALTATEQALDALVRHRSEEGHQLADFIRSRCVQVRDELGALRRHIPELQASRRQRIKDRIAEVVTEASDTRLEEELVLWAQRADVEEEMDRMDAHLDAIETALSGGEPCGRRLDFLMQELNREANTLSSKSASLPTTSSAVEFKVLIEQMREQIQNIE
ncbi:conserved hypothetical protein TIGR00255 [Luminiphilus syltensis NOR5-1B]|uniref:YicC family protein n=1 Tax=Luminiphilus syltensis NOR5-1B TaxID=565045 RepID=B8KUA3_9GAMM|nr:YicC/YloC family endoribonuclease [Luminiphilus syltensis]EED34175.1 conserved hypothetical protein TIGR00255 [Luminiphilus syltensis NOR5-1B]